ncbi:MAG: hypothetical protein U9Q99_03290 [Nanoarchaeota archaeon]|nr:hypothetical protein [Nanoarchaeota archaeon]
MEELIYNKLCEMNSNLSDIAKSLKILAEASLTDEEIIQKD